MDKIEQQKENIAGLLELVKENPGLRIVPMVDSEVIGEERHCWWAGAWGKAELDEIFNDDSQEMFYLRSWGFEDVVQNELDNLTDEEIVGLTDEEIEELAEKKANALPWEKVIAIRIITQ